MKIIKKFLEDNNLSLRDLQLYVEFETYKNYNEQLRDALKKNSEYVGKCFQQEVEPFHKLFPKIKRFYKVLSERSSNEYRVACLIFDQHIHYWFETNYHKVKQVGDYILGEFSFNPIWTDSIMVKDLKTFKEISIEEYNEGLKSLTNELINTKFTPNHYRFGGILPSDSRWEIEED